MGDSLLPHLPRKVGAKENHCFAQGRDGGCTEWRRGEQITLREGWDGPARRVSWRGDPGQRADFSRKGVGGAGQVREREDKGV